MKLKEIPRTATFAWSPDQQTPTIVTGTAAGTIDASFDATTELELWTLDLLDHSVAGFTPTPKTRIETESRFHDLAFNRDGSVVVGAFESGVVEAWKAPDLTSIGANNSTHSGAVKSVAFSDKELNKFATGGAQGQVFVWDVARMDEPFAPGAIPAQRHDDVESVAWNHATAQILASGGNKGFASLWDTRRKREVLHLYYTSATGVRCPISSVQWHPTISTKLATASMDDNEPVICIWDLKNANSPEKILRGHNKGVLSLDWCRQDESLMLSGGRDNATILWNPTTGEQLGSYPISVEWAFKAEFHPRMPDIFASASFDGKIAVQTLQDTHAGAVPASQAKNDGSDFWESENVMDAVHPNFKLQQPPKWLEAPTSINFGFGGKLVIATYDKVVIKTVRDSSLNDDVSKGFGEVFKSQNFQELATKKSDSSLSWKLLAGLLEGTNVELPKGPLDGKDEKENADEDEDEDSFDFVPQYAPANDALKLLTSKHPAVVKAILANDFDTAVSKLISAGEPGDALLIATLGEPNLVARAQNAYLTANAEKNAYLRAAWDINKKSLSDLVDNTELEAWPSVLRSILELPDSQHHTYTLGKRLVDAGERDNALRIYFAGKNVAALASLWLDEVPEIEKKIVKEGGVTAYVAHVRALQQVVEKIATVMSKLGAPPVTDEGADRLYSALRDYADIASQQGDLELAKLLLDMLPDEFADDKQRINVATETAATAATPRSSAASRRGGPNAGNAATLGGAQSLIPPLGGDSNYPISSSPTRAIPSPSRVPARGGAGAAASGPSSQTTGKSRYAPNSYANVNASSVGGSSAYPGANLSSNGPGHYGLSAGGLNNAAASAAASAAAPPPPPAAVSQSSAGPGVAPFKGWNDIPELPGGSRRTPAAPTRVAPPPQAASVVAPPTSATSSRRGSTANGPPPPAAGSARARAGVAPPPPSSAGSQMPNSGAIPAPPRTTSSPRPLNPYAPKLTNARASPVSASGKTNPYAPPPGSVPSPATSAPAAAPGPAPGSSLGRPPSRATAPGPPPRARAAAAVAPPPMAGGTPSPIPRAGPPTRAGATGTPLAPTPPAAAFTPPPRSSSLMGSTAVPKPGSSNGSAAAAAVILSADAQAIRDAFQAELARVQPMYEAQYAKLYKDTVKRLQKLYEHLPELSEPVIGGLIEISESFAPREFAKAKQSLEVIITQHSEEAGEWLTGVKRLVNVSEKLPVA